MVLILALMGVLQQPIEFSFDRDRSQSRLVESLKLVAMTRAVIQDQLPEI